MFTDDCRDSVWQQVRQRGLQMFGGMLTPQAMQAAADAAGISVGRSALNVCTMAWLGVVGAVHTAKNFADVLTVTWKYLDDAGHPLPKSRGKSSRKKCQLKKCCRSKHAPQGHSPQVTEEAFAQARGRFSATFWACLLIVLAEAFQQQHPERVRWKRFRLMMLDGTNIALPRWKRLLDYFGASGKGKNQTPQARMVMLAMAQARLPWRYEVVPQSCHEQTAAKRLFEHVERDDLVLMDKGFWSYGLFWQLQRKDAYFGVRLRAGTNLRRVKRLGHDDELVDWQPVKRSKKKCSWADSGLPKSIRLRVIRYRIPGFRASAVVTNALDPREISRDEWVRMALVDGRGHVLEAGLYHRRWEIETMFHELKVIQGLEGSLRGRKRESIEYEIGGHVVLYFLVRWLMVEAAGDHDCEPLELSFKHALQELEDLRPLLIVSTPTQVRLNWLPKILRRIAQHKIKRRPGRHYPRLGDKYKLGKYRKRSKLTRKEA
jgi:hypothetical protein